MKKNKKLLTEKEIHDFKCLRTTRELINKSYVGDLLKQENYIPFSYQQANEMMEKLLRLKDRKRFFCYYNKERLEINENNFNIGFFEPIWKQLNNIYKMQVCYWFINYLNYINNTKAKFLYVPENKKYCSADGAFVYSNNSLYININALLLSKDNPYYLILVIAHEMEHAKQEKKAELYQYLESIRKLNLYEKTLATYFYINPDLTGKKTYKSNIIYSLYKTQPQEKSADLAGVKFIKKIVRANEQLFGVNEKIRKKIKAYEDYVLNGTGVESKSLFKSSIGINYCENKLNNKVELFDKILLMKELLDDEKYQLALSGQILSEQIVNLDENDPNFTAEEEEMKKGIENIKKYLKDIEEKEVIINQLVDEIKTNGKITTKFDESILDYLNLSN